MIAYYFFFLPLAFDYKGLEEGGSFFQYLIFLVVFLAGIIIICGKKIDYRNKAKSKLYKRLLLVSVISSFPVALFQGIDLSKYIRISAPFFLMTIGYFVTLRAIDDIGFRRILKIIAIASFLSITISIFNGLYLSQYSNNGIRYQILSPMIGIGLSLYSHKFFVERNSGVFTIFFIFSILLIVILSATRSALIGYFTIILSSVVAASLRHKQSIMKIAFRLLLFATGFLILGLFIPNEISSLYARFDGLSDFHTDVTTLTRLSEIRYQLTAFFQNFSSFLFGNGLGAYYGYYGGELDHFQGIVDQPGLDGELWFAGHNFWIYSLFSQGLFGLILPFVLINSFLLTLKNFKNEGPKNIADINSLSFVVIISILVWTIGGNPLISRLSGLFLGAFFALAAHTNDAISESY
jgi:hypothetical protein